VERSRSSGSVAVLVKRARFSLLSKRSQLPGRTPESRWACCSASSQRCLRNAAVRAPNPLRRQDRRGRASPPSRRSPVQSRYRAPAANLLARPFRHEPHHGALMGQDEREAAIPSVSLRVLEPANCLHSAENRERAGSDGNRRQRLCKPELTGSIPVRSITDRRPARLCRPMMTSIGFSLRPTRCGPTPELDNRCRHVRMVAQGPGSAHPRSNSARICLTPGRGR
jgi:hypothetical protein